MHRRPKILRKEKFVKRSGQAKSGRPSSLRPLNMKDTMGVPPRENAIVLNTNFLIVANNATVLNPFTYSYLNLTNPQISNGGSATVVPFYASYAMQYRKFRVRGFSVRLQYGNNEAFFVVPFTTPFNYLPPNTVASNTAAFESVESKQKMASAKGGVDRAIIGFRSTTPGLSGWANTNTEDAFVGNTDGTSPPSDNIYTLVSTATNGLASVGGILVRVQIRFEIDFVERQTPASLKRVIYTEELRGQLNEIKDRMVLYEKESKGVEREKKDRDQFAADKLLVKKYKALILEALGRKLKEKYVQRCIGSGCPPGDPNPDRFWLDNRADSVMDRRSRGFEEHMYDENGYKIKMRCEITC